jgi:acyl-CoA synthetase (AMP-forming)/AMP-acid ligase II
MVSSKTWAYLQSTICREQEASTVSQKMLYTLATSMYEYKLAARQQGHISSFAAIGLRACFSLNISFKTVDQQAQEAVGDRTSSKLWLLGPSSAAEYFFKTPGAETFQAKVTGIDLHKTYLHTDSLVFLQENYLYWYIRRGRIKDLIIIDDVNYYPQDIGHVGGSRQSSLELSWMRSTNYPRMRSGNDPKNDQAC